MYSVAKQPPEPSGRREVTRKYPQKATIAPISEGGNLEQHDPSLLSVVTQKVSEHQPLRNVWVEQGTPHETSFPFEFIKNQRKAMIF